MPRRRIAIDPDRAALSDAQIVENKIRLVGESMFRDRMVIDDWDFQQAYYRGPGEYEPLGSSRKKIKIGEDWGGENVTAFFRKTIQVPEIHQGRPLFLDIRVGGEALLSVNGRPLQGLDYYRSLVYLTEKAQAGTTYHCEIEAFVRSQPFEKWFKDTGNIRHFEKAFLLVIDREIEDFYYDVATAFLACKSFTDDTELYDFLFEEIDHTLKLIDFYEEDFERYKAQIRAAKSYLQEKVYRCDRFKRAGQISLVGQSHLDIVFMWPYIETIRKNIRTTASVLNLMREFPELLFSQSQQKLYEDLEQYAPELFQQVRQRQREGRWECIGGMYIEPDCNLISGESFVRQILYGKRYFRSQFGTDAKTCWLPDVFGMSWSIPQILLKAGMKYVSSIKLTSWNDYNDFPYHTFWWQGVDGSRVLTHFPNTHFNRYLEPKVVKRHWDQYLQKRECGDSLMMYGMADGGSGPTREMINYAKRLKSFPGLPACKIDKVDSYFERISRKVRNLPVWNDELYLEGHRGTYTSAALLKRLNRRCECLYREAEIFSSFASLMGLPYPQQELEQGWKKILLHQFHDTLPGSHPKPAFEWAVRDLEKAVDIGTKARAEALNYLGSKIQAPAQSIVVFNSLPWKRTDVVKMTIGRRKADFVIRDQKGKEVPYQVLNENGKECEIAFIAQDVPSVGYRSFYIESGSPTPSASGSLRVSDNRLENQFFILELDQIGNIKRLFDKRGSREILAAGERGNVFQLFEDKPGQYSAWDIIPNYKDTEWKIDQLEELAVEKNGPVMISLRRTYSFLSSQIRQEIVLYSELPRIDFLTLVNWRETEKLLKVSFPVDILSKTATYDIPFGNITRPTHTSTSWDEAKFEVCGHKWADLSEGDYGVSILNDCKYGHDIRENVMRLTLLKAPTYPNPVGDKGEHIFTYSLYPHPGSWREAETPLRAYELNAPLVAVIAGPNEGGVLPPSGSFVELDRRGVFIEAIKKAEDSEALVFRFVEQYQSRGPVGCRFMHQISSISECNLLEEVQKNGGKDAEGRQFSFYLKPYEIKSFLVRFKF